ncbi:MAG: AAA family ATPase [Candidatus Woesearchaeota archaeon]
MSYVIILRGPAGAGKTLIGKRLASNLEGECIHIDEVLKENGLDYIVGERCVPEKNLFKVNDMISQHVKKQLQKGKMIVLEGNFYHKSQIKDLFEKIPGKFFAFTLKASLDECVNRDTKRKGIGKERVEDVFRLVSAFDYGTVIDTNKKTPAVIVKEIMTYLPRPE